MFTAPLNVPYTQEQFEVIQLGLWCHQNSDIWNFLCRTIVELPTLTNNLKSIIKKYFLLFYVISMLYLIFAKKIFHNISCALFLAFVPWNFHINIKPSGKIKLLKFQFFFYMSLFKTAIYCKIGRFNLRSSLFLEGPSLVLNFLNKYFWNSKEPLQNHHKQYFIWDEWVYKSVSKLNK